MLADHPWKPISFYEELLIGYNSLTTSLLSYRMSTPLDLNNITECPRSMYDPYHLDCKSSMPPKRIPFV